MERQTTLERLIQVFNVSEDTINKLGRLIDLEKDKERITSLDMYCFPDNINFEEGEEAMIRVRFYVKDNKWFKDKQEFNEYLNQHSLSDFYIEDYEEVGEPRTAYIDGGQVYASFLTENEPKREEEF